MFTEPLETEVLAQSLRAKSVVTDLSEPLRCRQNSESVCAAEVGQPRPADQIVQLAGGCAAAVFTIGWLWNQSKYVPVDEWIKKTCNAHRAYYLALKRREILPCVTTWMNLEDTCYVTKPGTERQTWPCPIECPFCSTTDPVQWSAPHSLGVQWTRPLGLCKHTLYGGTKMRWSNSMFLRAMQDCYGYMHLLCVSKVLSGYGHAHLFIGRVRVLVCSTATKGSSCSGAFVTCKPYKILSRPLERKCAKPQSRAVLSTVRLLCLSTSKFIDLKCNLKFRVPVALASCQVLS